MKMKMLLKHLGHEWVADLEHQEAQKGGITDPSWDAHYECASVQMVVRYGGCITLSEISDELDEAIGLTEAICKGVLNGSIEPQTFFPMEDVTA